MDTRFRARMLIVVCAMLAGPLAAAPASAESQTYDAAVHLLEESMVVRRDGRHNALLRALRHLQDPQLRPLYAGLADAPHPALKVHGILGLAETADPRQLDLTRAAAIEETAVQAELLSAALDGDLVPTAEARTLLGWADLDEGIKLLIIARMLEDETFASKDRAILREAMDGDNLARASLAALLLLESGDDKALPQLQSLASSQDPTLARVKVMLLETALRHELRSAAPWAYAVATDPNEEVTIQNLALRVAMRFGDPRAVGVWRQRFVNEQDLAERTRYALIGLHLSPWLDAGVFDTMIGSEDPFIRQAGVTAAAVARGDSNLEVEVVALLQTYHPLASKWALTYAREVAAAEDAHQILLGLILLYEHGPQRGREQRLADAVEAARVLHDLAPEAARQFLRPIIASPQTDNRLVQAILLGLVRAKDAGAGLVLEGLGDFTDPTTNQLALLLRLRSGQALTDLQQKDLSVLIRGGGQVQDQLRVQAGWQYLVRTGQSDEALREALATIQP